MLPANSMPFFLNCVTRLILSRGLRDKAAASVHTPQRAVREEARRFLFYCLLFFTLSAKQCHCILAERKGKRRRQRKNGERFVEWSASSVFDKRASLLAPSDSLQLHIPHFGAEEALESERGTRRARRSTEGESASNRFR